VYVFERILNKDLLQKKDAEVVSGGIYVGFTWDERSLVGDLI